MRPILWPISPFIPISSVFIYNNLTTISFQFLKHFPNPLVFPIFQFSSISIAYLCQHCACRSISSPTQLWFSVIVSPFPSLAFIIDFSTIMIFSDCILFFIITAIILALLLTSSILFCITIIMSISFYCIFIVFVFSFHRIIFVFVIIASFSFSIAPSLQEDLYSSLPAVEWVLFWNPFLQH